jgi:uncharacterized protein YcbK (DUF882 family)
VKKLTPNFHEDEFACPCCKQVRVDPRLVEALQELRDLVGVPIRVTTFWGHAGGYRCLSRNQKAGGAKNSLHLTGQAADIVVEGLDPREAYHEARKVLAFDNGGIGVYPPGDGGFIHVDVRTSKKARWARVGGKYVPLYKLLQRDVQ